VRTQIKDKNQEGGGGKHSAENVRLFTERGTYTHLNFFTAKLIYHTESAAQVQVTLRNIF